MIARGDAGEPLGWLQETAAAADNGRMRQTGDVCARADEATRLVAGELSGQERAAYVKHTESCERCAGRVSALRGADGLGAVIARELEVGSDRFDRTGHGSVIELERVRAEAGTVRRAVHTGSSQAPISERSAAIIAEYRAGRTKARTAPARVGKRWRLAEVPVPKPALAAMVALAVFAVATVSLSGQAASVRYARIQAGWRTGGAALKLYGSQLELLVEGMPRPPAHHGYQVWVGRAGQARLSPTDSWLSLNRLGEAGVNVPGDYHHWYAVAVYVEPLHGRDTTASGAVVAGDLAGIG